MTSSWSRKKLKERKLDLKYDNGDDHSRTSKRLEGLMDYAHDRAILLA